MRVRFVQLLQKNINISLSKREVGCHTKRTTSMAEVYSNDAVEFKRTFKLTFELLLEHLGYTYIQTKESADRILIIYNVVSSLTAVASTMLAFYTLCCSAGAHSRPPCSQEL